VRFTWQPPDARLRAEGGEFEDDSDIELEEEDYDPTFTTGGVAWRVRPANAF